MPSTINFYRDPEWIALQAIKPLDDSRIRGLIRFVSRRVNSRQLSVDQFVEILIDEVGRLFEYSAYSTSGRKHLKRRVVQIIDDLVSDPDLRKAAQLDFREKWLEEQS